jgi:hypothetical protein
VLFGPDNAIVGYSVEKGSEDQMAQKRRLKESQVEPNEPRSSYRVDVTDIKYSNGYICNFRALELSIGVTGSQHKEDGEYHIEVVGSVGPLDTMPSGLAMLKEYSDDKELMIGIRDDPHVRYIPDEDGRVRKAIDRRGFDSGSPAKDRSNNGDPKSEGARMLTRPEQLRPEQLLARDQPGHVSSQRRLDLVPDAHEALRKNMLTRAANRKRILALLSLFRSPPDLSRWENDRQLHSDQHLNSSVDYLTWQQD